MGSEAENCAKRSRNPTTPRRSAGSAGRYSNCASQAVPYTRCQATGPSRTAAMARRSTRVSAVAAAANATGASRGSHSRGAAASASATSASAGST